MSSRTRSRRRAAGVGLALLLVVLAYEPAGLGALERSWVAAAALLLGLVAADALAAAQTATGLVGAVPATLLAVACSAFLCVPETDQFPVVVVLPVGLLLAESARRTQVGPEWSAIAAAGVGWAGLVGSAGRQSALIGALFAWWPLVLPWAVQRLLGIESRRTWVTSAVVGAVAAVAFARSGGLVDEEVDSLVWLVGIAAGSAGTAWVLAVRWSSGSVVGE